MTLTQWYYAKGNRQLGPVSSTELKQLAESGDLVEGDLVWREGMEEWIAARKVKGLFVTGLPESPTPTDVEPPPVQTPSSLRMVSAATGSPAARPRISGGTSRHPFDLFLDFARRRFAARFVDSAATMFAVGGYYGLFAAMILLVVFCLLVGVKGENMLMTLAVGLAGVLILFVLQYIARRFLDALEQLNRSTPARMSSTALLDCCALLLMFAGVVLLVWMVVTALSMGQFSFILPAVGTFILCQYAAILSLNPASLNLVITAETSAGEEAIGLMAFLIKLVLRVVPVAFGVGIVLGTCDLAANCVQLGRLSGPDALGQLRQLPIIISVVTVSAALPFVGYAFVLLAYLFIDVVRAILELPRVLDGREPNEHDHSTFPP